MKNDSTPGSHEILVGLPVEYSSSSSNWGEKGGEDRARISIRRPIQAERRLIEAPKGVPLKYSGESHLLTIAPTGAGKGRSVIIPNLLNYSGPVVVFDPKGENYQVTARRRKEMGQKVVKLDPFGVIDSKSDSFNPFDVFGLPTAKIESDSQMLADLLAISNRGATDPFWDLAATGLISGLIAFVAANENLENRNLSSVWHLFGSEDLVYDLAVKLDTLKEKLNRLAFQEFAFFLQLPSDKTRPSVLGTAKTYLQAIQAPEVLKTLSSSTFSLREIIDGEPLSIYMIIPPDKIHSHAAILKLWVGVLFRAITSRKRIPKNRTLFILDECAQLGSFPFLESVVTLCRGYGLQVWTLWQDLSQLKHRYPVSWATMLNNCDVLQIFGARNHLVASEFAEVVGASAEEVRQIELDQQVVVMRGGDPMRARRYDYLNDKLFTGLFEDNPLYSGHLLEREVKDFDASGSKGDNSEQKSEAEKD